MTGEGYIMPEEDLIENMFFRKPGLPILFVRFPDGREVPYWNTFYQEVRYDKLDAIDLVYALDIQYPTAQKLTDRINAEISSGKKPKEIDFGEFSRYKDKVLIYWNQGGNTLDKWI